jgi:hypothetical protein
MCLVAQNLCRGVECVQLDISRYAKECAYSVKAAVICVL